jgi:3-oxoacyl-[acyl-carrier-protein] synthase II
MKEALKRAGAAPEEIDYINAHGTSTPMNDVTETVAIKKALGQQAYQVPISSTKSMTGHLIGGAGGVEAVATALSIERGIIHATINLDAPGEDCDLNYVPNKAIERPVRKAISNGFGFGGLNAVIVLERFER